MEIDSQVSAAGQGTCTLGTGAFSRRTTELRLIAAFLHNVEYESPNRARARARLFARMGTDAAR